LQTCHPERSDFIREANEQPGSKDPGIVDLVTGASGNSLRAFELHFHRAGRTPRNGHQSAGLSGVPSTRIDLRASGEDQTSLRMTAIVYSVTQRVREFSPCIRIAFPQSGKNSSKRPPKRLPFRGPSTRF